MRMNEVLVIGHRNPDTDAICSALGYAEFKRRTDLPNAVAARCGDLNERVDFVLKTFGVEPPKFVTDITPRVRDVMESNVLSVLPQTIASEALGMMDERNLRVLPVLREDKTCKGLLSLFKMSRFFFPAPNRIMDSRRVLASIRNIAQSLNGKVAFATEMDREEDLVLIIGAMTVEAFGQRLDHYPKERLIVVVGDRWDIQNMAIRSKVRLIVVTGGLPMDAATLEYSERNGVSILLSPHDTAMTAMLCRSAITVDHMIEEQFLAFQADDSLVSAKKQASESTFSAFPVLDPEKKTIGILSKSDFLKEVNRKLILVDHNELSQAVEGAEYAEILEIIDHHRIGALNTHQPIFFRNEPVGSTSTIVADSFFRENVEMPKPIAGVLLAGVVSDTLNLTSPTATKKDHDVLARLAKITEIQVQEFTEKLFSSGSLLISKPIGQAIKADCKEYKEGDYTFSVAQIEEIGFDQFWKHKNEILQEMENYCQQKLYLFSALLVTDIVKQNSLLVLAGAEQFMQEIKYPKLENKIFELHGVVSRKKQLLPYLIRCLAKLS